MDILADKSGLTKSIFCDRLFFTMGYLTEEKFKKEIKKEFKSFEISFAKKIDKQIEQKIDARFEDFINGPFADMKFEIMEMRAEMRTEIKRLDQTIDEKFNTIINKIDCFLGKIDIVGTETTIAHVRIDRLEAHVGFAP